VERLRLFPISLALLLLGAALSGCSAEGGDETAAAKAVISRNRIGVEAAVPVKPFRFFSPHSFWNTPVAGEAALDPASEPIVAAFVAETRREVKVHKGPGISTTSYGVPIYTAPRDQPTVRVKLTSARPAPALQAAWQEVPLPDGARPAGGGDATLVLWQPSTDRLWEFWRLRNGPAGWEASWGGAMQHVSANPGVYGPGAWPDAKTWWGSSASSLSIAGGVISVEDLRQGQVNHALAIAVSQVKAGVYASPARRTDGTSTRPYALPEGAHLRLDPSLDLSTLALPPTTRIIAEAAQRFGIFVRDGAGVTHFFAQDPVNLGGDPYAGPDGFFEGHYPGELLASFPWEHLQLLPMALHPYHPAQPTGGG
jgi:hypothetical protein